MRTFLIIVGIISCFNSLSQGKYITRNGMIEFNASSPLEKINPVNNHVSCILDTETGKIAFQLKMISFKFERALMEEHFNEKYVESEKYPTSTFVGSIVDWGNIDLKSKLQNVEAKGILTIHGVDKEIEVSGTFNSSKNIIQINSNFDILLSDYNVKIPNLVKDKISEKVSILLEMKLQPK